MNEGSSQPAASQTTSAQAAPSTASPAAAVASNTNPAAGTTQAAPAQQTADTGALDMTKIFGEDFAKDPALKDFKDPASLVKAFKDTKALVGKPRFDVPGQDTPPEQAAEFWKKLGVPDSPEAYGLKPDANVPEHNNEANTAFLKTFEGVAHELKLNQTQAAGLQKFFDDMTVNLGKTAAATQAEEDAQLDSLFSKALGAEKDVAAERIKGVLEKVLPAEMRPILAEKMSNEALTAIALLEKHFRETYGQSDKNLGDNATAKGSSVAELRKDAQGLYSEMQKVGPMDPAYKGMKERYDAMYKTIGELTKAQK